MGVVHFAPVGTRPGAVTSALAYLKHNQKKFTGFKGQIVESIVIFTSSEVRNGSANVKECFNNEYGSQKCLGSSWKNLSVLNAIRKFTEKELVDTIPVKGSLSVCVVNHNDYNDCFDKIGKAVLILSPNREVGKNIWANLTGGTNILNAALLDVALLSGRISRVYYTFLSDVKKWGDYLQPPATEKTIFDWREIPFVKTIFDEGYYAVLKVLDEVGDWCEDSECLNRLKNKGIEPFKDMDIKALRRVYLNIMDEREIERKDYNNRISEYGKKVLDRIQNPMFRSLVCPENPINEELKSLIEGFKLEELWCKQ